MGFTSLVELEVDLLKFFLVSIAILWRVFGGFGIGVGGFSNGCVFSILFLF